MLVPAFRNKMWHIPLCLAAFVCMQGAYTSAWGEGTGEVKMPTEAVQQRNTIEGNKIEIKFSGHTKQTIVFLWLLLHTSPA